MSKKPFLKVFLLLAILLSSHLVWADQLMDGPEDPLEFETFLDGIMAAQMRSYKIAGAAVVVVKGGEIFYQKGYGYSDIKIKIPVNPSDTLFKTGSTAKLLTWTAVMQLVEQGKLDLNRNINDYLKHFKIPDTYQEPITLTHLLTHTPGFEDLFCGYAIRNLKEEMSLEKFLPEYMPARIRTPGKSLAYSNYGAALAGYIVESVSGLPFNNYIKKNIFEPLGMNNSSFKQDLPIELKSKLSNAYSYKNGQFKKENILICKSLQPAGTMSSTAEDMGKFMIAHLNKGIYKGNRILTAKTIDKMHSRLYSINPKANGMAHGFWEYYYNGLRLIEHGGDTFFFHSMLTMIPDKHFGIYVSYNSLGKGGANSRLELIYSLI